MTFVLIAPELLPSCLVPYYLEEFKSFGQKASKEEGRTTWKNITKKRNNLT